MPYSLWRLWAHLVWMDYGRHSAHAEVEWGCPICMIVFWRVLWAAGLTGRSRVLAHTDTPVLVVTPVTPQTYGVQLPKDLTETVSMMRRIVPGNRLG